MLRNNGAVGQLYAAVQVGEEDADAAGSVVVVHQLRASGLAPATEDADLRVFEQQNIVCRINDDGIELGIADGLPRLCVFEFHRRSSAAWFRRFR